MLIHTKYLLSQISAINSQNRKYMKQKENRKKTYVSPKAECVRTEQDLLQMTPFSGDHKDAPDDGQPLNARRIDSFGWEDEEDDGESSYGKKLDW